MKNTESQHQPWFGGLALNDRKPALTGDRKHIGHLDGLSGDLGIREERATRPKSNVRGLGKRYHAKGDIGMIFIRLIDMSFVGDCNFIRSS